MTEKWIVTKKISLKNRVFYQLLKEYSKIMCYYAGDKTRLSQSYNRCLLAQNAHLTIEEFKYFLKRLFTKIST